MSRLEVIAIETFFREGRLYRPSDRLSLPIDSAKALERSGLVRTIKAVLEDSKEIEENKKKIAGSLSQVEEASPKKTATRSRAGRTKTKKTEE